VSNAESSPWQSQIEANLGITQNQLSDNWQGGGASGLAWVSSFNAQSEKQLSASLHWKHLLKLAFGQMHNQDQDTKKWLSPVKSNDQIDYETVLRITRGWFVDPVISGRLETQFVDQTDPSKAHNFNPLRLSEAVGVARNLIKSENRIWDLRLGFVSRQIINDAYSDQSNPLPHRETIYDGGLQLDSDFKAPVSDRLSFASKLTLTGDYQFEGGRVEWNA